MPDEIYLCQADEIPDASARGFDPEDEGMDSVFFVRIGGRLSGWVNDCPHTSGTPLAWHKDEFLNAERTRIKCFGHRAEFDAEDGACVLGPCLGEKLWPVAFRIDEAGGLWVAAA